MKTQDNGRLIAILFGLVVCGAGAVNSAEWISNTRAVPLFTLTGFIFAILLATRKTPRRTASFLLAGYSIILPTLYFASLWPIGVLFSGWRTFAAYTETQLTELIRNISYFESDETALALLLAIVGWLLASLIGWWTLRENRPMRSLPIIGIIIVINTYWGNTNPIWVAVYIGLSLLLFSYIKQQALTASWGNIPRELPPLISLASGLLAVLITLLAYRLPTLDYGYWLEQLPGYRAVEAQFDDGEGGRPVTRPSIMPRTYLINEAPELLETIMMTATVSMENPAARHWRALSFDIYTGDGWTFTPDFSQRVQAGEKLRHNNSIHSTVITQTVHWLADERVTRYSLGQPVTLDQDVVVSLRDERDLFRVQGRGDTTYTVVSKVINAPADRLRSATNAGVTVSLLNRYTQLPDSIPERVHLLASDIITGQVAPFDQAKAIETYLRQYEYTLDVPPPPEGVDPVDYFLFDAQQGYCDYYASSMVVLARSVGLPARMGVGFLAQTPDENGIQTIRKADAHTWAEIYFAGIGWVEFEPTAPFPIVVDENSVSAEQLREQRELTTLPLPGLNPGLERPESDDTEVVDTQRDFGRLPLIAFTITLTVALLWLTRRTQPPVDIFTQYTRLQQLANQLGVPTPPNQTPAEFQHALTQHVEPWRTHRLLQQWQASLPRHIKQLTEQFTMQQYAPPDKAVAETVNRWQAIRHPLLIMRVLRLRERWGQKLENLRF